MCILGRYNNVREKITIVDLNLYSLCATKLLQTITLTVLPKKELSDCGRQHATERKSLRKRECVHRNESKSKRSKLIKRKPVGRRQRRPSVQTFVIYGDWWCSVLRLVVPMEVVIFISYVHNRKQIDVFPVWSRHTIRLA